MFSNKALRNMILPLFFEQLLLALVGMADVFVVGFEGEEAVSGVSLVNAFNIIFLNLFVALASGGAVVISQAIGRKDDALYRKAASQLALSCSLFGLCTMAFVLLFRVSLMQVLFGKVSVNVLKACLVYVRISAYSFPFMALYNAGAAMMRSVGKTKVTMDISLVSNGINVVGNLVGVFVLKMGVAGVAWPSFIARGMSAVWITYLCLKWGYYQKKDLIRWYGQLQMAMLRIAVPSGIESGIFQLVKVALSSLVAMFGTYQIAANGIAQSIWSMAALGPITMGPIFITVIGQCMGARDMEGARYYFRHLTKIGIGLSFVWNMLILAVLPLVLRVYPLQSQTKMYIVYLVLLHNFVSPVMGILSDSLGKGLRACGDVNFATGVSLFTTLGVRLIFSYVFALWLGWGVMGIAVAMCLDWSVRGLIFWYRVKGNTWQNFAVLRA